MITLVSFPYPLAADMHKQVSWENLTNDYLNIIWIYIERSDPFRTQGLKVGWWNPLRRPNLDLSQMGG